MKALSLALAAASLGLAGAAFAVEPQNVPTIEAWRVCRIDIHGNQIGPWIYTNPDDAGIAAPPAPVWDQAFDGMHLNIDPVTFAVSILTAKYRTPAAGWWSFRDQVAPTTTWGKGAFMFNDMKLKPGTEGAVAGRVNFLATFNPNGANVAGLASSGIGVPVVDIFTAGYVNVDPTDALPNGFANIIDGWRAEFVADSFGNGIPAGSYNFSSQFGTLAGGYGAGWGLPTQPGGGYVVIARKRAATITDPIVDYTGAQSFALGRSAVCDPLDTLYGAFAGTNPTSSDVFAAIDLSGNGTIEPAEYVKPAEFTLPTTGTLNNGNRQPTLTFSYDSNATEMRGTVTLSGLSDPILGAGSTLDIEIVGVDALGAPIAGQNYVQTAALGPNGEFRLIHPRLPGIETYRLSVKPSHWLRKNSAIIDLSGPSVTGISLVLKNGDVNGDNEVGAADFSALAAAYDAVEGDPNYDADADLNEDGEVGAADFSILAANYDEVGDDDLTP